MKKILPVPDFEYYSNEQFRRDFDMAVADVRERLQDGDLQSHPPMLMLSMVKNDDDEGETVGIIMDDHGKTADGDPQYFPADYDERATVFGTTGEIVADALADKGAPRFIAFVHEAWVLTSDDTGMPSGLCKDEVRKFAEQEMEKYGSVSEHPNRRESLIVYAMACDTRSALFSFMIGRDENENMHIEEELDMFGGDAILSGMPLEAFFIGYANAGRKRSNNPPDLSISDLLGK